MFTFLCGRDCNISLTVHKEFSFFTRDLLHQDSVHLILLTWDAKVKNVVAYEKGSQNKKGRKLKIDESTFLVTKTKRDLLHLFTYPRRRKLQPSKSKIHTKYILHLHY